jgi:hypothetical protein
MSGTTCPPCKPHFTAIQNTHDHNCGIESMAFLGLHTKIFDQVSPEHEEQDFIEALEDLGAIYLRLYGTTEPPADVPKLYEDPEIIDGIRRIYGDCTNPSDNEERRLDLERDLVVLRELEDKYAASRHPVQPQKAFSPKTAAMYLELFGEQNLRVEPLKRAWTWPALRKVLPIFSGGDEGEADVGVRPGKGVKRGEFELMRASSSRLSLGSGCLVGARWNSLVDGFEDNQASELYAALISCPEKTYQAGRRREGRGTALVRVQPLPQLPVVEVEMKEFDRAWQTCFRREDVNSCG